MDTPYRQGFWLMPDLLRDYCDFWKGLVGRRTLSPSEQVHAEAGRSPRFRHGISGFDIAGEAVGIEQRRGGELRASLSFSAFNRAGSRASSSARAS